jgi:hypothetical protein
MKLPAQYAKFLTAVAGNVVVYLQWKYGASGAEWLPIVLAAASALGVYAVPNAPKPAAPAPAPAPAAAPPDVTVTPPPA